MAVRNVQVPNLRALSGVTWEGISGAVIASAGGVLEVDESAEGGLAEGGLAEGEEERMLDGGCEVSGLGLYTRAV